MAETLFIYFGDDLFNKLNSIALHDKQGLFQEQGCKIFNTLKEIQSPIIKDVYLGWSNMAFNFGKNIYCSGFSESKMYGDSCHIFPNIKEDICCVSCGFEHYFLHSKTGNCYYFSKNLEPVKVDFQDKEIKSKNVISEDTSNILLTEDGKVYSIAIEKEVVLNEIVVPLIISEIACGKEHVLLLSACGTVFSYGSGSHGQLGHDYIEKQGTPMIIEALQGIVIESISAGGWHSAAISDAGDLYMWGWNESGQLGLPCMELQGNKLPASQIETLCCLPKIIDFEHEVKVVAVSCGSRHSAALTDYNQVWTWGWNGYGQLGHTRTALCDKPEKLLLPKNFVTHKIKCKFWSTLIIGTFNE